MAPLSIQASQKPGPPYLSPTAPIKAQGRLIPAWKHFSGIDQPSTPRGLMHLPISRPLRQPSNHSLHLVWTPSDPVFQKCPLTTLKPFNGFSLPSGEIKTNGKFVEQLLCAQHSARGFTSFISLNSANLFCSYIHSTCWVTLNRFI